MTYLCKTLAKMVDERKVSESLARNYQRRANAIARKNGFGKATDIIFYNDDKQQDGITIYVRLHR